MLSFKQLEAIFWVSQLGTFAAAADKLHASESTISKRLSELETFFGVALFDRSRRKARLTHSGAELAGFAQEVLHQRDRLLERMGKEAALVRHFRVGVTELVALTWLPLLLQRFQELYPDVSFQPEIDLSTSLCSKLEQGAIDMIIVPPIFAEAGVVAVPLQALKLTWMCQHGLLGANRGKVGLRDVASYSILTQIGRSGVDAVYDKWFRARRIEVRKVYAGNSLVSLAALTVAGFGVSYLPALYFSDLVEQGALEEIEVSDPMPDIPYYAVYRDHDSIAGFNEQVARLCAECCDFAKPSVAPAIYRIADGTRPFLKGEKA